MDGTVKNAQSAATADVLNIFGATIVDAQADDYENIEEAISGNNSAVGAFTLHAAVGIAVSL